MKALLFTAALVAALGLAGNADVQEAEAHGSLYCDMVELYESSNGVKLKTPRGRPMVDNPVRNRFKVPKIHEGPERVLPDPFRRRYD